MNAILHSKISVSRRKGEIEDYLPIHDFIDSTKELCSDNRHRVLHTMWGIKRVIIPVFGRTLINSSGKEVNIKDLCEQDHILPDYRNRFIPTLSDFVDSLIFIPKLEQKIKEFQEEYIKDEELAKLLLSPLSNTGKIESLLITHNSWFLNDIVPIILKRPKLIKTFTISPSLLFSNMRFEPWMDNGLTYPKSAKLTFGKVIEKNAL